jgi:phosphate:Na+ symporter
VSDSFVLLELAGYVGLLLWGTHMVTSGVQRGFGAELRHWLGRNLQQRWRAFLVGIGMTALLQSSTATGLMATSFTVAGLIGLGSGLAVMLGANVGTTLITQVMSFNIAPLAPPLILAGVLTFRSSDDDRIKNLGRVAIGLGLMLLALKGLTQTLVPIETAPALRAILGALSDQPVLLVLLAAILTWGCHSSIAVVLLIVSLAATRVIAPTPALALVLGANVGSAIPALVEAGSPVARRLPLGNAVVRLIGCAVALPLLPVCVALLTRFEATPGRLVVNFHTAFNLVLAFFFISPTQRMARLLTYWLPDPPKPADPGEPIYLEATALDAATIALTNASRETLRMADMIEAMLRGALLALREGDRRRATEISRMGRVVDRLGGAIRSYLADLGNEQPLDDEDEGARAQEILSAVINLEHVSNIVASSLMEFAVKEIQRSQPFSAEEIQAIAAMHAEVLESLRLALSIFLHSEPRAATRLIGRKASLRDMEAHATALHVRLLRDAALGARAAEGDGLGFAADGSGLFLRIVCDLRRVHSHIATFAYAALYRNAQHSPSTAALDHHDAEVGSLQPTPEAPDVCALQKLREQAVRDENRTEPGEIAGR